MTFPLFASVVGGFLVRRRIAARRRRDPAQFLATVSHELRTPLNVIAGWVSLLKSGTLAASETARALDCIERNVQRETRLVDELLDASRVLGGRATLAVAPLDWCAAVRSAIARVSPVARAKGVDLLLNECPPATMVSGDERQLVNVVSQLVSNAVQFTPPGGEVRIDLHVRGERACLRVADTGDGIAPEDLPHVFEPFLQGRTWTKRAGLGLGLAVARQLVKLHGGTIAAHSAGLGQGAVFSLSLPLVSSQSDWRGTTR